MSEIDHVVIIEMFYVALDNRSLFQKNRTCSYSFSDIPVNSISFVRLWAGVWVGSIEFIGVVSGSIRINELSLKMSLGSDSKGSNSWMDVGSSVDGVGSFDFSLFC